VVVEWSARGAVFDIAFVFMHFHVAGNCRMEFVLVSSAEEEPKIVSVTHLDFGGRPFVDVLDFEL
jgi:hypothetical protein